MEGRGLGARIRLCRLGRGVGRGGRPLFFGRVMFEFLVVVKKCCDEWVLRDWDGLESEWCWKWKGSMLLVGVELK